MQVSSQAAHGLTMSQLWVFWAKSILCVFAVLKLILLFTALGLSDQPYPFNFASFSGIVPPSKDESDEDKVLKGVVRVEMVQSPSDYIPSILTRCKKEYMVRTYRISDWNSPEDFLEKVAQKSGKLLKGGEPDINTVAKMILNDWQRGKIPFFVPPPGCEMPPPPPQAEAAAGSADSEKKTPKDVQDFSQIRVSHKFDMSDDLETSGIAAADADDVSSQNDNSIATDTSADLSAEVVDDGEEVASPRKKKKQPQPGSSKSAKKVKTASGVFEVFDAKWIYFFFVKNTIFVQPFNISYLFI